MRKIYPLLLLLLFAGVATAKNPGYQGKRFVLKTDLSSLVDRGGSVSFEMALLRQLSLEPEYRFYNRKFSYTALYMNDYDFQSKQTAHIIEHAMFLTLKLYTSSSKTAPKGFYSFIKFGMGGATVTSRGYFDEEIPDPDNFGSYKIVGSLKDYKLKNIKTIHAALGIGVNYIFAKRIVADIAWGFQYSNMNGGLYEDYLHGYQNKFGPNVISFFPKKSEVQLSFGLMFKASIGVLLF